MTIFDKGDIPLEVSTIDRAAQGVVASILPEHIEATKNTFVYVRSMVITPNQLFKCLKKRTKTSDKDWKVDHVDIQKLATDGQNAFFEAVNSGDPPEVFGRSEEFMNSLVKMVCAALMGNGGVNQFGDKPMQWMQRFGMVEDELEIVVKDAVEKLEAN